MAWKIFTKKPDPSIAMFAQLVVDRLNQFNKDFATWGGNYTPYDDNGQTYIDKGYKYNPDFYAVVNRLTTKSALAPLLLKKAKNVRKYKNAFNANKGVFYKTEDRVKFARVIKEQLVEEVEGHEIFDLLDKPNEYQTYHEFIECAFLFLFLTGNCYIWKRKPTEGANKGKPIELYVLPSHLMKIDLDDEGDVSGYSLNFKGCTEPYEKDDVIHINMPNPDYQGNGSHYYGQSPALSLLRTLQSSNEALDREAEIMANGGVFGFLSNDSDVNPLSVEQAKALHDKLKSSNRSKEELARLFITNGTVKYVQVGLKPTDLEFIDSSAERLKTFCRVYHVNPILFGIGDLTYENLTSAWRQTISDAIAPNLMRVAEGLTNGLIPYYKDLNGAFFEFDASDYDEAKDDVKVMAETLKNMYWVTPNEARFATYWGMSDDPNMDKFYFPAGLIPIDQVNAEFDFEDLDASDYGV